jgi:N-acetylmuramate 1-kinase
MGTTDILKHDPAELTPAQIEFLTASVDGFALDAWGVEIAGQAGSQRRFVRVSNTESGQSYILVIWDSRDEDWQRFLRIQEHLADRFDFLPLIYSSDERHGLILEEDLGTITLKRFCMLNSTDPVLIEHTYQAVLDALVRWQQVEVAASPIIASRAMDLETFLWETSYFARHCVTDFCACERVLTPQWEQERKRMAIEASALPRTGIHRDFQSENIMVHNNRIRFVDYQGARLGPPQYDTASLLFDPYIDFAEAEFSAKLFGYYCGLVKKEARDSRSFNICAAQRLMQALGAYGNLSIHKGKSWYRAYVPRALERLGAVMEQLPDFIHTRSVIDACRESLEK